MFRSARPSVCVQFYFKRVFSLDGVVHFLSSLYSVLCIQNVVLNVLLLLCSQFLFIVPAAVRLVQHYYYRSSNYNFHCHFICVAINLWLLYIYIGAICLYVSVFLSVCLSFTKCLSVSHIYIYIYRERERERDTQLEKKRHLERKTKRKEDRDRFSSSERTILIVKHCRLKKAPTVPKGTNCWLNLFNAELSQKRYWMGPRSQEVREEGERLYLTLYCHHQNDSCIKMASAESQFNVSSIVRGQSHKDTVSISKYVNTVLPLGLLGTGRKGEAAMEVCDEGDGVHKPQAF